jgi:hypothetical protein
MTTRGDTFGIPGATVIGARAGSHGHVVIIKPTPRWPFMTSAAKPDDGSASTDIAGKVTGSGLLIAGACVLLAALAVAMGITSFHAQFTYIYATKHQRVPSMLEALGLDCGAVIFSLLGIALARLGRRAVVERVLVIACALGSCGMNALNASLGSPRSVAVWALPPVLFALTSDRLISVIRRAALGRLADDESQRSAWHMASTALLYVLRFALAPPSTAKGARQAVLNATPLPHAPRPELPELAGRQPAITSSPRPVRSPRRARGTSNSPTKTARFLDLVAERHGPLDQFDVAKVSKVAADLAPEVGLHQGSARRELRAAVLAAQDGRSA